VAGGTGAARRRRRGGWCALIEEAAVIDRILRHLGLPTAIPAPRPAPLAIEPSFLIRDLFPVLKDMQRRRGGDLSGANTSNSP
jgi:hypothetical protein